eukprot:GFYU01052924.1.p2 GENE.GFYU01052924.1~~GFYU01052924.1.p2  ORF type:complete len:122 (+),score=26.48 GFYU01052924.1:303-668(+)
MVMTTTFLRSKLLEWIILVVAIVLDSPLARFGFTPRDIKTMVCSEMRVEIFLYLGGFDTFSGKYISASNLVQPENVIVDGDFVDCVTLDLTAKERASGRFLAMEWENFDTVKYTDGSESVV